MDVPPALFTPWGLRHAGGSLDGYTARRTVVGMRSRRKKSDHSANDSTIDELTGHADENVLTPGADIIVESVDHSDGRAAWPAGELHEDENPDIAAEDGDEAVKASGGDNRGDTGLPAAARLMVYILGFAILGVSVGLGYSLLGNERPIAETPAAVDAPPIPVDSKVGDNKPLTSDDPLREWNIRSAAYISPLISQLARKPRETLGGQILLCREQRGTLEGVLALTIPPGDDVAAAFDSWRNSLKRALDRCISVDPSGNDKDDVKRIVDEVEKTESLFADFLRLQRPKVDVSYDANPEMFEK